MNELKPIKLKVIPITSFLSGGVMSQGSLDSYLAKGVQQVLRFGLNRLVGPKPKNEPYIPYVPPTKESKEKYGSNKPKEKDPGPKLASKQDGQVQYLGRENNFLKRALTQTTHQITYGYLRSYPRYLKYFEQQVRDEYLKTESNSSLANKEGQYYKLISQQRKVDDNKTYTDSIVGRIVYDYLELDVSKGGEYYDPESTEIMVPNEKYGAQPFVDLQPQVQVSSKNNIVLTTVQGRDFTRKELVSGGDYEITINGKITSKYPEVYPEAEVSKFIKLMQFRGILSCDNTILCQFNISQLIVLNYSLGTSEYRNVQPYTISCVAVEPSEAVTVVSADAEIVDKALKHTNKWLKWAKLGAEVIDPSSLLKFSPWV